MALKKIKKNQLKKPTKKTTALVAMKLGDFVIHTNFFNKKFLHQSLKDYLGLDTESIDCPYWFRREIYNSKRGVDKTKHTSADMPESQFRSATIHLTLEIIPIKDTCIESDIYKIKKAILEASEGKLLFCGYMIKDNESKGYDTEKDKSLFEKGALHLTNPYKLLFSLTERYLNENGLYFKHS